MRDHILRVGGTRGRPMHHWQAYAIAVGSDRQTLYLLMKRLLVKRTYTQDS